MKFPISKGDMPLYKPLSPSLLITSSTIVQKDFSSLVVKLGADFPEESSEHLEDCFDFLDLNVKNMRIKICFFLQILEWGKIIIFLTLIAFSF